MRPLITLGGLSLPGSEFQRAKLLTLLAYLGLEGRTPRRHLQALFWNGEAGAAASLRVGLHQLRRVDPTLVSGTDLLEVQLDCDATHLLDGRVAPMDILGRYTGPFLHGVRLDGVSTELEEWIDQWRDRLALIAQRAGLSAAETAASPAQAALLAERAYRLSGAALLEPDDLRRLRELSAPGSSLERELTGELRDLGPEESRSPSRSGAQAADGVPPGLLGRHRETGVLLQRLAAPLESLIDIVSRLTEVTGPGGIGKTTLVDAVLREYAGASGVRVASVDAEALSDSASLAGALAQALGLPVQDQGDAWGALGRLLGDDRAVLALHGTEHLPDLAAGLDTLLGLAPTVQLVVTSRVRMTSGTHLRLGGLPLPPGGADWASLLDSPTVQLFVRAATRAGGRVEHDDVSAPLLGAVVRRLDGHPLALALAGSWTVTHSLRQIHALLLQTGDRSLESLDSASASSEETEVDLSPLHRVFGRSWKLLGTAEQLALTRLAVFAGFSPEDAQEVAGVGPAMLERLETHSLLRQRGQRWQVFPVLAAQVTGEPGVLEAARAAHARHYRSRLLEGEPGELLAELPDLHLAVMQLLNAGNLETPVIDALLTLHDRGGLLSSGNEVFTRLVDRATELQLPDSIQAGLLIAHGWLSLRAARPIDAGRLAGRALEHLSEVEDLSTLAARMKALNVQAAALDAVGQPGRAMPMLREAAELAHRLGDVVREARYLANLGTLAGAIGTPREGEALLLRAVELLVAGGHEAQSLVERLQLLSLRAEVRLVDTVHLLPEATELVARLSALGAQQEACRARITLARLNLQLNPQEASRVARQARTDAKTQELPVLEAAATLVEAAAQYLLGHSPEARRCAVSALDLCVKHADMPGQFEAWLVVAADLSTARPDLSAQVLQTVECSGQARAEQRQRGGELRREIFNDRLEVDVEPALATARLSRDPDLGLLAQLAVQQAQHLSAQVRLVLRGATYGR